MMWGRLSASHVVCLQTFLEGQVQGQLPWPGCSTDPEKPHLKSWNGL